MKVSIALSLAFLTRVRDAGGLECTSQTLQYTSVVQCWPQGLEVYSEPPQLYVRGALQSKQKVLCYFLKCNICCTTYTTVKTKNLLEGCSSQTDNQKKMVVLECLCMPVVPLFQCCFFWLLIFLSHFRLRNTNINPFYFRLAETWTLAWTLFTGPASTISSQLKHGNGYFEGKWWMHWFWGYP